MQQMNTPCPDPIVESVVGKLRSRSEVGIGKYGTTLADNPAELVEWLTHLQEELMDAVNYIERAMGELNARNRN